MATDYSRHLNRRMDSTIILRCDFWQGKSQPQLNL